MKREQSMESPRSLIEAIAHEAVQRYIWNKRPKHEKPGAWLESDLRDFFNQEERQIIDLVTPLAFALGRMTLECEHFLAKDFESLLREALPKVGLEYIPPRPSDRD